MFNETSIPDTVVLAITVDSKEDLKKVSGRVSDEDSESHIELLSDPDHKVIDRYGLLNPNGRGLPHPATYIIDKKGIVRWKFVEVDYSIRPDNEQVLEALRSITP
jgi:peroxiredoxin